MKAFIVVFNDDKGKPVLLTMTGEEIKRFFQEKRTDYAIISGIVLKQFGQEYDVNQLAK